MNNKIKGFTLLEIIVSMAIISIMLTIIVPSFRSFYEHYQQKISAFQLLSAIQTARQEAIVRGETVTLCKSRNLKTCSGEWRDGYIVLAGDKLIYAFQKENNQAKGAIHWRARLKQEQLQFMPNGLTRAENGTFLYCEEGFKSPSWLIILNKSGKAHLVWEDHFDAEQRRIEC